MKKALLLLVAFTFVACFVTVASATDLPKPVEKLAKGAVDVVKSPLTIYDHTKSEYDKSDIKPLGFIKGLTESPFHFVKKAGGGVIDMATFPIE